LRPQVLQQAWPLKEQPAGIDKDVVVRAFEVGSDKEYVMHRFHALAVVAAFSLVSPAAADDASYIAQNGMTVHASGPNNIVVPMRGHAGSSDFWCAAGDFVHYRLRVPTKQILYRVSEPPKPSGAPIVFSLRPEDSASSTGVTVFGGPGGGGMKVGTALGFCESSHPLRPRR
jgi:hypothetical protein